MVQMVQHATHAMHHMHTWRNFSLSEGGSMPGLIRPEEEEGVSSMIARVILLLSILPGTLGFSL